MNTFTTLRIGSVEFPNRLLMAPVKTAFGTPDGKVTYRHEAYYRRRAEGGVGAIIVEPCYIDPLGKEHPKQLGISSYDQLEGLKRLVEAIHEGGALAVAHLNHAGRAANPKATGIAPEAPSAVSCPTTGATPVEMTRDRIKRVALEFAGAARRAVEAGFDAIEVQFGLGYLIAQFLSARTNLRIDPYGGNAEHRYRFAAEVMSGVIAEVDDHLPVIARISASEQTPEGMDIADAIILTGFLREHGVAALHVVSGSACDSPPWYYQHMRLPLGKNLEWAEMIKEKTDLPVIVAGRLGNPRDIRNALDNHIVDAVALGRPLVADPDLPRKMNEGRDEAVIQCGACLQGCLARVKSGAGLGCVINPEVGLETDQIRKPSKAKKVVVVGGGPAGMQAALSADRLGHKVILFEKNDLGGQFNLSWLPPGKAMMKRPLDSIIHLVKQSNIDIRSGTEADVESIIAENPDQVIIATGATPILPSIPGARGLLTGEDVLTETRTVGRRALIIGGGMVGLETAEFLVRKGHEVTVVELLDEVARDMLPITRKLTLQYLTESGVKILRSTEVTRIDKRRVFGLTDGAEKSLGEFDSVIVAVGTRSVNELEVLIRKHGIDVTVVGDARAPRQIMDAVREGFEAATAIRENEIRHGA
ncbi:MAG: NAD(P)/FAD-dependent oxidoreductase [Candidatus Zixiibacteriota bacterium]|jgi:2,4-dienoyl-CoA reductase-like NADH-dependent reductase (Old Yellow Enzyme family)/thioredoxin reductase